MTGDVQVAGLQSAVPSTAEAGSAVSITLTVAAKSVIVFIVADALVLIALPPARVFRVCIYTTRAKGVRRPDHGNVAVVDQVGLVLKR